MSERKIKRRKLIKFSVGDMRDRISLEIRDIKAPKFGSQSFTEKYTVIAEVWAMVETKEFSSSGQEIFEGVNDPELQPSHIFAIRQRNDVTSETRIRWRDKLYQILPVTNLEERGEYLSLNCKLLGDDDKEANQ